MVKWMNEALQRFQVTTSKDLPSATSSQVSADGQSLSDLRCGATIDLFGQVVAHANHSAAQESKKATAMSATYGRIGQGSSESVALQSYLESRLREQLPLAGGMMYPQIWKRKVTPARRQYCQLAVSASPINGIDYGLWPTATAGDATRHPSIDNTAKNITLNHAALWATPNTMDGMGDRAPTAMDAMFKGARKGRTAPSNLREQVNPSMWPTPNAGDDRDRGRWENPSIQRRVAMGKQINLSMIAQGCDGLNAQTGKQGQLNPAFVCWLMGYSTAHLSSMLLAMQSFPKSRRSSSKQVKDMGEQHDAAN